MSSNNTEKPAPRFFGGYSKPNYTQVPDELFDEHMAHLTGAQLRVLLYIIRRTFGFKKDSDAISLSQICGGIVTSDGRRLDHGTGLAKRHAIAAAKALVEMGLITAERQASAERGHEATIYSLNMSDSVSRTLVPKGNKGSTQREQGLVPKGNTQETDKQETVRQETDLHNSNIRMVSPEGNSGRHHPSSTNGGSYTPPHVSSSESVGEILAHRTGKAAGPRRSKPRPETETEEWQTIQAYVIDFARLLGDGASTKASTARAYNLFLASGLPISAFVDKMYQARALTQESSAGITKTHTDERGYARKTKMAYWFAVLEDQLKPESKRTRPPHEGTGRGANP